MPMVLSLCWISAAALRSASSAVPWARCASPSACCTASAVPRTPSARNLQPGWHGLSASPGWVPFGAVSPCPHAHLALWASCSSCPAWRTSPAVCSRMASTLARLRTRSLISSARRWIWAGEAGSDSSSTRLATTSMLSGSAPSSVGGSHQCVCPRVQGTAGVGGQEVQHGAEPLGAGQGQPSPPAWRHSRLRKALTWLMRSRSSLLESSTRALVWFALSRAACARCRASSAFPLASATWAGAETLSRGARRHPTCFYPCPCDTHPVGELGHLAGRVPQLLLGMPRSI